LPEDMSQMNVGRTISMEEFRNIPIGNSTSRDFTSVVESSATASSAGISLGGSTAPARLDKMIKSPTKLGDKSPRVRLKSVAASESVKRAPVRRAFRSARESFGQCLRRADGFGTSDPLQVAITLRWDARGKLVVRIDGIDDDDVAACVEKRAYKTSWPPQGADTEIVLRITLAAR